MFVPADQRDSADYRAFWAALNRGEYQAAEYKRIAKGGREVWIEASYNPVLRRATASPSRSSNSPSTSPQKKIRNLEDAGKISAINRAQAVIEFNLDGTIVTANENFLKAMGYSLARNPGQASQHVRRTGRNGQRGLSRVLGSAEPRPIPGRPNTSASARAARKSGFSPPTIRCWTRTASRSRSSSSRPTSPRRS